MSSVNERALARLSVSAFAVDAMVVTLLIVGGHELLRKYILNPPEWVFIIIIPIVLGLHFLVVEFLAGGISIGRLSAGLTVRDEKTGVKPRLASSFKRSSSVLFRLGIPSLNPNILPKYNKMEERSLCSDWVGTIPTITSPQRPKSISKSKNTNKHNKKDMSKLGLQVIGGPNKGLSKQFQQGRNFSKNQMFIVGRDANVSDLVISRDSSVSMVHLRIALKNDRYYIIDGKSSSQSSKLGTTLNGSKVLNTKPRAIKAGDVIQAGKTTLRLE